MLRSITSQEGGELQSGAMGRSDGCGWSRHIARRPERGPQRVINSLRGTSDPDFFWSSWTANGPDDFLQADFRLLIRSTASKPVSGQLPPSRHRHQFPVQDREWQTSCPLHTKESPTPPSSAARLICHRFVLSARVDPSCRSKTSRNKRTTHWYSYLVRAYGYSLMPVRVLFCVSHG